MAVAYLRLALVVFARVPVVDFLYKCTFSVRNKDMRENTQFTKKTRTKKKIVWTQGWGREHIPLCILGWFNLIVLFSLVLTFPLILTFIFCCCSLLLALSVPLVICTPHTHTIATQKKNIQVWRCSELITQYGERGREREVFYWAQTIKDAVTCHALRIPF